MKKGFKLNASNLRIILLVVLVLVLAIATAGFYYVQNTLRSYAKETSALNSKASASDQNNSSLQKIQAYLAAHSSDVLRADQVVADSKQYRYQNDIVDDISRFASQSGVTVTGYDFAGQSGAATSTATPSTTAPAATPSTTTTTAAPAAGSTLKSTSISVTVKTPVDYDALLKFISRIEQNLTKMQIASISLSQAQGGGKNQVTTEGFDIEVYVR